MGIQISPPHLWHFHGFSHSLPIHGLSFPLGYHSTLLLLAFNLADILLLHYNQPFACLSSSPSSKWLEGRDQVLSPWIYNSTLYRGLPTSIFGTWTYPLKLSSCPFYSWEYKGSEWLHGLLERLVETHIFTSCSLSSVPCLSMGSPLPRWWVSSGVVIMGMKGQGVSIPALYSQTWTKKGSGRGGVCRFHSLDAPVFIPRTSLLHSHSPEKPAP